MGGCSYPHATNSLTNLLFLQANERIFITHCKTNQHLSVHTEWMHRTPFGREYEVTACTKFNTHKAEDVNNHFMLITGDPQELAAVLMKS